MKQNILAIDDCSISLELISEVLEHKKINIIKAKNGDSGIQTAGQIIPDLILLDVMMPGQDGFEVCKVLKKNNRTKDIPVIFLSAKTKKEDVLSGLKLGAVDYITKPFNKEELQSKVKNHLELQKTKDALIKEIELRKDTEEMLLESINKNEDYEKLLDANRDIVFMISKTGKIIYFNKQIEDLFGYKRTELIGKLFTKFIPVNEIPKYLGKMKEALITKHTLPFETVSLHKNGSLIPVEISGKIIKYNGKTVGIGTIKDISYRKKIENKLLISKTYIQSIISSLSDFVFVIDKNGYFTDFYKPEKNSELYDSPDDFIGKHYNDFLPSYIAEKTEKSFKKIKQGKNTQQFDYFLKTDNKLQWFNARLSIFKNTEGKFDGIIATVRDITERKLTENALKESEEKYKILFEKSNDAILLIDEEKFIGCNLSVVKMLGYKKKSDLLNTHPSELSPKIQSDGRQSFEKAKEMMVIACKKGTHKFEWVHTRANGEDFPVEVWLTAIPYKNKKIIHTVWRDLTERNKTKQALKESESRFKALSEATNEAIFISKKGICIDTNKAASKMFGYSYDEMVGKFGTDVIAPESKEFVKKNILSAYEKPYDVIAVRRDGTKFHAEIHGRMFKYTGKDVRITAIRNISERKNAEIIIKEKIEELQAKDEELLSSNERLFELNENISKQKDKIEKSHNEILSNIKYAKTIQDALLTPKRFIDNYFNEYFLLYKPKDQISGDFYYINKINDYIICLVADCTGHGIPGGLLTMIAITYIHEIVRYKKVNKSSDVLNILRQRIKSTFTSFGSENTNGFDIAFCAINTETNILQYAGAFNPLWIIRSNELLEYKATRNPIGFYPKEVEFKNNEIQLQDKDKIYLFSDGFYDQLGGKSEKKFTKNQFKELIIKNHKMDFPIQKSKLEKELIKWKGKQKQIDDITVMGLHWQIN